MLRKSLLDNVELVHESSLQTLIENRSVFSLEHCELNLFETYQYSEKVPLEFNDFVVTSMLRGKKRIHYQNHPPFEYLPGETFIIPPRSGFKVDFPEASGHKPTQCIALAIDSSIINETIDLLNEKFPKEDKNDLWKIDFDTFYFYNSQDLANTINKITKECMSESIIKDALAYLSLQELIIRIMQTQTLKRIDENQYFITQANSPIAFSVDYIRAHIGEHINLKELSKKACMSTSTFYRNFKRELGLSPAEFIIKEKIKYAKRLLTDPYIQINEVSFATGFEDSNYFIRIFKKYEGITPKQYQLMGSGVL